MKVLMINVVCGIRSTGRICTDLADALCSHGHEVKIAYGREDVPEQYRKYGIRIGSDLDVRIHGLRARLHDDCGFGSKKTTERFVEWIKQYDPDVIHLHNLHGYYINVDVLFAYLKDCGKRILWTLHDCWAFTGHAAYCEAENCERWVDGCYDCPKKKDYPVSFVDRCAPNWKKKKEIMTQISNLSIVTPSNWLAHLVERSYLNQYPIEVIHNGVDTDVFRCIKDEEKTIRWPQDTTVVLGVAAVWDHRKGLRDFIKMRRLLNNKEFTIVLIGLTKKQFSSLPEGIIGIERTNSVHELVEYYNAADVFVNPTYEENYPTTNIESIACGTPVITYATGGSGESASIYGKTVNQGDIEALVYEIQNFKLLHKDDNRFGEIKKQTMIDRYIELYDKTSTKLGK